MKVSAGAPPADRQFFRQCVKRFVALESLPFIVSKGLDRSIQRFSPSEIRTLWMDSVLRETQRESEPPMFQLYLHLPLCERLCHFCNLNPLLLSDPYQLQNCVDHLIALGEFLAPSFGPVMFRSLFFGGGTPSLLNESQLDHLFSKILKQFRVSPTGERCIEVHPSNFNASKLDIVCRHGFNKINLGVQSLDPRILAEENRSDQSNENVYRIAREIKKRGEISLFNMDLLLGMRGESDSFLESFEKIAGLKPETITLYPLRPTEGYLRRFYQGNLKAFYCHFDALKENALARLPALSERHGYRMESHQDRWYFLQESGVSIDKDRPYADRSSAPVSVLGLGFGARSHISQTMAYVQTGGLDSRLDPSELVFRGHSFSRTDEQFKYVTGELLKSPRISARDFESLFGNSILDIFKTPLRSLQDENKIRIEGGDILFPDSSPAGRIENALTLFGSNKVREIFDAYNFANYRFPIQGKQERWEAWVERLAENGNYIARSEQYGLVLSGRGTDCPPEGQSSPASLLSFIFLTIAKRSPHLCADEITDLLYRAFKRALQSRKPGWGEWEAFEPSAILGDGADGRT